MGTTTFDYKVRDRDGKLIKGKIEAESLSLVAGKLRTMGYSPVEIKQMSSINLSKDINIPGLTDRVKLKDVATMSRQLATLVGAGLTLVRSLAVLGEQITSKPLKFAVQEVRADLERGSSFSAALERHPKVFNQLYVSMIRAGEVSGQLDTVLMKLSSSIEKQVELRSKVRSAMTYPIVILCVVVLIVTAMMIIVVPTFKNLYSQLHGKLPFPTQIVIQISNVVASYRLAIVVVALVVSFFAFRRFIKTERGRLFWDNFKLKPPVFGALTHKAALARFASTLASLLASGVGIIEALDISADNVGNRIVADAARGSEAGLREGRSLAATLTDYPVIPLMVTQMIETGEEAGAVDDMLDKVAEFYDNEVTATVNSLTSLLEPMIIVFMGVIVGAIVISLYLPMFNYVKLLTPS